MEAGAQWPDACLNGTISTLPKEDTEDPSQAEAGALVANVGLATRPITNLSPLYCAYSSVRFDNMASWRELWLPQCAHGARKQHEVHDPSWQLSLMNEVAEITRQQLGGVAIDKTKFFDMLNFEIGHNILSRFGAPDFVINAQRQFYSRLKCRYKINAAFSNINRKGNGFAQGDSYSLQVALGFMAVWTNYTHSKAAEIHTGSFVDDAHFFALNESPDLVVRNVINAWQATQRFDQLTGLVTNRRKTHIFANTKTLEETIIANLQNSEPVSSLQAKSSFRLVGSVVTVRDKPESQTKAARIEGTLRKLQRIRIAPLRFKHRVTLAEAVFAGAIFGREL